MCGIGIQHKIDLWIRIECPKINTHMYGQLKPDKSAKKTDEGSRFCSMNDIEKT
jgi:hypothetical protein